MTTICIYKNACIRNPSHNGKRSLRLYHDDLVIRTIKTMRRKGSNLIEYDECDKIKTTMVFENRKGKQNAAMGNRNE